MASGFTDRYAAFKHLEPDIGPLAYWLQIYTTIDQCLCQISSSSAESVRPDGNRTRNFVCIKELDGLVWSSHTYATSGSLVDVPLLQEKVGTTSRPGSHYIRNNWRYLIQAVRQIQSGPCPGCSYHQRKRFKYTLDDEPARLGSRYFPLFQYSDTLSHPFLNDVYIWSTRLFFLQAFLCRR